MVHYESRNGSDTIVEETVAAIPTPRSPELSSFRVNPFDTPLMTPTMSPYRTHNNSRRPSMERIGADRPPMPESRSYFATATKPMVQRPYFRSRRVRKDEVQTPRTLNQRKDPKAKWNWIIPLMGVIVGLIVSGILIWLNLQTVASKHNYCPVLSEDFSSGRLDPSIWTIEVQVGGFGNGEFEETTNSTDNLYIENGQLHIKPTLQDVNLINQNSIINLTQTGTCTSTNWYDCVTSTNTTNGTIVQPVRSARLNTKKGASIKYGRVEVVAKISQGDWLWPAIWMQATDDVYGTWPRSGEIDILEARGNNHTYENGYGGNNIAGSTLHWGPDAANDGYLHTTDYKGANHQEWGDAFHTYGLEWTEDYLFTYIDTRLLQVLYVPFKTPLYQLGDFPAVDTTNGTELVNPWAYTGRANSPFDQLFYLTLNVAVGGTNGWFPDSAGDKPWVNTSPVAKTEFWDAKDQWFPSWQKSSEMVVDSVKMWQQC